MAEIGLHSLDQFIGMGADGARQGFQRSHAPADIRETLFAQGASLFLQNRQIRIDARLGLGQTGRANRGGLRGAHGLGLLHINFLKPKMAVCSIIARGASPHAGARTTHQPYKR